jgi:hypothetical protein
MQMIQLDEQLHGYWTFIGVPFTLYLGHVAN